MTSIRRVHSRRRWLAGASGLSLLLGAMAAAAPAHAQSKTEDVEEVVVTGSRVKRSTFDAPAPTTVVNAETIQQSGAVEIVDVINELPQIAAGNFGGNTSFSFGNVGLNQLNLRNLGTHRTLTLVNGRRRVGTPDDANFLAYDLSNLPTSLIERVDVITGGTSAVYGSDAVAGVVNLILRKDFEGLEFDARGGQTTKGDWSSYSYGVTAGVNYDRGNAVINISHSSSDRLLKRERGLDTSYRFLVNPANTSNSDGIPDRLPYRDVKSFTFGIPTLSGFVPDGPAGGPVTRAVIFDSTLNDFRPFDAGPRGIIQGSFSLGPDGGRSRYFDTLFAPLKKTSVYSRFTHELTDSVRFNLEAAFADTQAGDVIGPVFDVSSSFVSTDNAFMPTALRNRLLANGKTGFSINRQHNEFGPRSTDIGRQYYTVGAGLEGKVKGFDWVLTYEYGETNVSLTSYNDRNDARWAQALDSIRDPVTGAAVCRDAAARAAGCVPVNVFGEGTISPAALDYVRIKQHTSETTTSQELVQGYVTGDLLQLWAGPLGFAAGFEHRRDAIDFRPSQVYTDATGFFASQFSPVNKSNSVTEAFGELVLPIAKDLPFAKYAEIEGAFRVSDYERAGRTESWNLGGEWAPIDDIRFRATRARAVRAPALAELFDPGSRGAAGITDPCDPLQLDAGSPNRRVNCKALGLDPVNFDPITRRVTTLVLTNGNEDLDVETADTWTLGVVVRPRFLPNLRVAVDVYEIKLDNAINRIGAQASADNCVDLPSTSNLFCQFVTRGADGNITEIRDSYVNVGGFRVQGVDFEVAYGFELNDLAGLFGRDHGDLGHVGLSLTGSYLSDSVLIDRDLVSGETTEIDDAGLANLPEWRGMLNTTWARGAWTVNWQLRYASKTNTSNQIANIREFYGDYAKVPALYINDVSVTYDTPWNVRLVAGVNDILDDGVRDHPNTINGTSSIDNIRGRYAFVGATVKLGR